jgi:cobalt/nickel transport protein
MALACLKQQNKKRTMVKVLPWVVLVIALAIVPLFTARNALFSGVDEQAEKAITEINPSYKPWFSPVWEPPSSEIEAFLFAIQAAIGAGFVGYYVGYARGRRKRRMEEDRK